MQLTVWYTAVLLIGLGLFSVVSWFALRYAISDSKNATLDRREQRLVTYLALMPSGALAGSVPNAVSRWLQGWAKAAPEAEFTEVYGPGNQRLFPVWSDHSWFIRPSNKTCDRPCYGRTTIVGRPFQTLQHTIAVNGVLYRLLIAASVDEHLDIVSRYTQALGWLFPVICAFSVAGGYTLSRRALRPVDQMTVETAQISVQNLAARLVVPQTGDELQRLAETWNALLGRLELAVGRLKQFTADASHDLRTGISIMLTTSELAVRGDLSLAEYRADMESIASECRMTAGLLDDLLTLARMDSNSLAVMHERTDLREIALDAVARFGKVAKAKEQQLTMAGSTAAIPIVGDESLLMRLLSILLDNAVKYTQVHGSVQVFVAQGEKKAILRVQDSGPGIAESEKVRIFDRFYRADQTRRRTEGGTGLGLAIAKWIAEAHQATIELESQPGAGSVFSVVFPPGLTRWHKFCA